MAVPLCCCRGWSSIIMEISQDQANTRKISTENFQRFSSLKKSVSTRRAAFVLTISVLSLETSRLRHGIASWRRDTSSEQWEQGEWIDSWGSYLSYWITRPHQPSSKGSCKNGIYRKFQFRSLSLEDPWRKKVKVEEINSDSVKC